MTYDQAIGRDKVTADRDAFERSSKFNRMEEDLDLGHEDNEPNMIKAELYHIGKCAMKLYGILDKFDDGGEVDLPSWWQSKISKSKEALVGAEQYLDFELNEPKIDAVVDVATDVVNGVDIEVVDSVDIDETVEDYITSVDDIDERKLSDNPKFEKMLGITSEEVNSIKKKISEKLAKDLKEGLPKGFWDKKIDAEDENQDGEVDESYNTLVNKIEKQGKSEKAAKAIAGAVASYKSKGGGKGPTAKQK